METIFAEETGPAARSAQAALAPLNPTTAHSLPNQTSPHLAALAAAAKPAESSAPKKGLLETLAESPVYQNYERAFSEATGLVLALRPVESWQLPHHRKRNENAFCALMAEKSRSCAACLQVQQRLSETASQGPQTVTCQVGMCDTAVPVRLGDKLIGFLQTGQVFRKKPTLTQYARVVSMMREWGIPVEEKKLKEAYFATRVIPQKQHDSIVNLLQIFAEHLSMVTNQVLIQRQNSEPLAITRAREFIRQHLSEDLSLGQVAKAVNTSSFYFCKLFKKGTGLNFTEYVSRLRIERAKNLLLNPNLRVSEIAFEIGFQSLTHFNRIFRKIVGQSPSDFRSKLPNAHASTSEGHSASAIARP